MSVLLRVAVLFVMTVSVMGALGAEDDYAIRFSKYGAQVSSRTLTADQLKDFNSVQYTVEVPKGYVARIAVTGSASWTDSCETKVNRLAFSGLAARYGFSRNITDTYVRWSSEPSVITLTVEVSAGAYVEMESYEIGNRVVLMPVTHRYTKFSSTVNYSIDVRYYQANDEYQVEFDANGGVGTMASVRHRFGTVNTLPACSFLREGHDFIGWSLTPNAVKSRYQDKDSVDNLTLEAGATVKLYAVWKPYATYHIAFDANGGRGAPVATLTATNQCATVLPACTWEKDGMRFLGWSRLHSSGRGIKPPGSTFLATNYVQGSSVTLYAVWGKEISRDYVEGSKWLDGDILTGGFKNNQWNAITTSLGARHITGACRFSSSWQGTEEEGLWLKLRLRGPGRFCFAWSLGEFSGLSVWMDEVLSVKFNYYDDIRSDEHVIEIPAGEHDVEFSMRGYSTTVDTHVNLYNLAFVPTECEGYIVRYGMNYGPREVRTTFHRTGEVYCLDKISQFNWSNPVGKRFAGWACSNGRRYDDGMLVFDLAKPGETVTMTAIWE